MTNHFEIKICGMRREEDILKADELGVDYVGFVFYEGSPRFISPVKLAKILDRISLSCRKVGVFVNHEREYIEKVTAELGIDIVQLHGDEDPQEFCHFPFPLWRALRQNASDVYIEAGKWSAERYVLDTGSAEKYGGTGVKGDWDKAALFARKYRIMLAGGLSSRNVATALKKVLPQGVDVSSGVEDRAGCKNHREMENFVKAVRSMEEEVFYGC